VDWQLAHRTIGTTTTTHTVIEAPTSHEAIDALRTRLPVTEQILFIRKASPAEPVMPHNA
jgi:hypothetical protein